MKVLSSGFCLSGRFPLWINCPYFGGGRRTIVLSEAFARPASVYRPHRIWKNDHSLLACQLCKRHFNRRIVTLEDPVETRDEDVLQVQVNEKAGVTYSAGLKAILRHDPDMIILGKSEMPRRLKSQSARP